MANRFLNNITINDEYTLPSADGTADQIITTDGAGQLSFVDQSTINAGNAERVVIYAKNTSGASISKGTPVYITGTVGATDTVQIAPADAGNSAKMPAVGLLDDTLANNAFGYVITGGFMDNIITDPIDGTTPNSNDTVYVKPGGGLTLTKPTGASNLIQNIAKVGKVSGGNSGSLIVSSILRTNDVPNLSTGKIWVGDGNTVESTVVHLDETNGRMGIGTNSPGYTLEVDSGNGLFVGDAGVPVLEADSSTGIFSIGDTDELGDGVYATNTGTSNFDIYSTGSIKFRMDSNGNVGIGTTNPDYKLEVNGTLGVSRTDGIIFAGSSGTGTGSKIVSNTSNDLIFSTALAGVPYTTTERVRILNNGNVGIGTDSPNALLEVKSNTVPGIMLNTTDTSFPTFGSIIAYNNTTYRGGLTWAQTPVQAGARITYIGFPSGSQKTGLFEVGANFVDTSINDGSMVTRLTTTGLGIGTTAPGAKLEVNGNSRFVGDMQFYYGSTSNKYLHILQSSSNTYINTGTSGETIYFGAPSANTTNIYAQGTVTAVDGYKGYVSHFHSGGFDHSPRSSDGANPMWIPSNYIIDTSTDQYYNIWIPLYAGRIRKIILKNVTGTPTATVCTFRKKINGVLSGTTYAGTVTGGGAAGMKVTFDFGTTNFTFNAEDEVQIGIVTGAATQPPMRGVSYQIWYEYNIT